MKKLLILILLLSSGFMFAQSKFEHETLFPERVCWTAQGKLLYGDYADSEKGKFEKIVRYRYSGGVRIWTIEYPTCHVTYVIRTSGNYSVIFKNRT